MQRLHSIKESSSVRISAINGSFAHDSDFETEMFVNKCLSEVLQQRNMKLYSVGHLFSFFKIF